VTPQVFQNSLHSQYVTTLVEIGVTGLATVALFLFAVTVPAARFAKTARDPLVAALCASVVAASIMMTVDTVWLDSASFAMILVAGGLAALGDPRAAGSFGD
jgi:O-antigen ligase